PERFLGQVGCIVNDTEAIEFLDERSAFGRKGTGSTGSSRESSPPPRQTDNSQAGVEPFLNIVGCAKGVGAFEEQDRCELIGFSREISGLLNESYQSLINTRSIPRQLLKCLLPGLVGIGVTAMAGAFGFAKDRGADKADVSFTQIGQTHRRD